MAARFWVGGTGTADLTDTTHWAATSGGAGGQSVPGSADTVTFDGSSSGGTVTIAADFNWSSLTCGAFTGTLDWSANNNNFTTLVVQGTGTGTRTLNMGNGTWTITGVSGQLWNFATVTNLTFNANSSSLVFNGTATALVSVFWGGLTYNNVSFTSAAANPFDVQLNSAGTFSTLSFSNRRRVSQIAATTLTVTTFTPPSGTSTQQAYYGSTAVATLSIGNAATPSWVMFQNITESGAGSIVASNSFDGGGNSNITINPPIGGARVIGG